MLIDRVFKARLNESLIGISENACPALPIGMPVGSSIIAVPKP
jgi:hypothetical protein